MCHTFNEFGQEVSSSLGLLDPIPLHDLSVPVDADVPRPARLGLSVQDGRVGHVVVLKHTLLKLALRREVFLKHTTHTGREDTHTSGQRKRITHLEHLPLFFFFLSLLLFIYLLSGSTGSAGNGSICGCMDKLHTHSNHTCARLFATWTKWLASGGAITQLVQFTCNKQQSTGSFTPTTV